MTAAPIALWKSAGIQPDPHGGWYRDLGQGMGATLNTAAMNAYTLSSPGPISRIAKGWKS